MGTEKSFSVIDPLGNKVTLDKERFENHIKERHPEVLERDIKESIENPDYIIADYRYNNHSNYFAHSSFHYPLLYVKTVVDSRMQEEMKVITAHLTEDIQPLPSSFEDIIYDRKKTDN